MYKNKITAERFDSFLGLWVEWFIRTTEDDTEKYLKFLMGENGFRNIEVVSL